MPVVSENSAERDLPRISHSDHFCDGIGCARWHAVGWRSCQKVPIVNASALELLSVIVGAVSSCRNWWNSGMPAQTELFGMLNNYDTEPAVGTNST